MLERVQTVIAEQREQLIDGTFPYIDPMVSQYRDLIYLNVATNDAFLTQDNGVHIFTDGVEKFNDLLRELKRRSTIFICNIILLKMIHWVKDHGSSHEESGAGCPVKFLYDDIGSRYVKGFFFRGFPKGWRAKSGIFPIANSISELSGELSQSS